MFDTVEDQFTGIATNFILKSGGSNVTGFATNTGVILLNEIFQNPADDYNIVETAGITSVSFTGVGVTNNYDVNLSSVPRGGIIVSVGESESFGFWNISLRSITPVFVANPVTFEPLDFRIKFVAIPVN